MSASNTTSDSKTVAGVRHLPLLRWRWSEDTGLVLVFVLMLLVIGIPHPEFFSFGSIKTILRQSALVGIIAFGMVYLVAMIEIDLSVGGIFAVASSLPALLIKFYHVDPWIAVAASLLSGAALGIVRASGAVCTGKLALCACAANRAAKRPCCAACGVTRATPSRRSPRCACVLG